MENKARYCDWTEQTEYDYRKLYASELTADAELVERAMAVLRVQLAQERVWVAGRGWHVLVPTRNLPGSGSKVIALSPLAIWVLREIACHANDRNEVPWRFIVFIGANYVETVEALRELMKADCIEVYAEEFKDPPYQSWPIGCSGPPSFWDGEGDGEEGEA
jgi:hypothetical protein